MTSTGPGAERATVCFMSWCVFHRLKQKSAADDGEKLRTWVVSVDFVVIFGPCYLNLKPPTQAREQDLHNS